MWRSFPKIERSLDKFASKSSGNVILLGQQENKSLKGPSRSSRPEVFCNFAKFTGKHLCQRLFFNKITGLRPETLLKKSLWHRCIPVKFAKFLRTSFFYRKPPVAASDHQKNFIFSKKTMNDKW